MAEEQKEEKEELPVYLRMIMDKDTELLHDLGGMKKIAAAMEVDIEDGIHTSSVGKRKEKWGENCLPPEEEIRLIDKIMEQFEDPMIKLLMAAAVISLLLNFTVPDEHTGEIREGGWIEGTAILVSVLIVALVSSANEYEKELKFKELSAAKPPDEFNVLRDGCKNHVLATEIVQGDVVFLKAGDTNPVDGLFIEGQDIKVDESAITGENLEIPKSTTDLFMVSGSSILEGECTMLCTGVGINCLAGRSEMRNREKKDATPLQVKLELLTDQITKMGMTMAFLTSSALFAKACLAEYRNDNLQEFFSNYVAVFRVLIANITVGITIIVVAVPEGLPLSVTIALAYSMKRMLEDQNLVRHLAACETMGGATQICSDKTGTLTQNKMTVVRAVFAGDERPRHVPVSEHRDYHREMQKIRGTLSSETFSHLTEGLIMNSTAAKKDGKLKGNKTECAMLEFVEGMDMDIARVREKLKYEKSRSAYNRHTYPFSSSRKSMTTLLRVGNDMRVHVKGASELVLMHCDKRMMPNGKVETMTEVMKQDLRELISDMARQALRTLLIAYNDRPGQGMEGFDEEVPDDKLTFVAILAIEDPMRPEVPDAVSECKRAGITVRMVTGDNKATAIAIAKQANIYVPNSDDIAMEGKDFRQLDGNYEKMTYVLGKLKVLARMTPLDKQILVEALRSRGEVVAVTGDGTNDAPALKLANVGFAMMTGTEVAKGASDIILMDDNFASVVTAAMWGRNINDNIRKFIQFQSTVNIAAVLIAFIGSVLSDQGESPLKPVQLLWLNLIMDSLAALALATERPTRELLDRPPTFSESPLISRRMWLNILGQGIYQIVLQIWLLNSGFAYFNVVEGSEEHLTIIFNVFVFLQVINEFNARKLRNEVNLFAGLRRAPLFIVIIVVTTILQILAVQGVGSFMGCVPLDVEAWKKCLLLASAPLPIGVFLRMIPVTEPVPPKPTAPEYVEIFRREKKLFDPTRTKGRGAAALKQAGREVIQQIKISASLSTIRRRRRINSVYARV
eukprot:TRINITY_DN5241_c0_g1_i1.p1 TRINITY_DN5241_c0_g1~~TRINITY_DN5241_c0_g1_i1.p1  ORF type:complete len:1028 (+),score=329.87 TRINITY_DN5241_c0_g1_i1:23-3085(+)